MHLSRGDPKHSSLQTVFKSHAAQIIPHPICYSAVRRRGLVAAERSKSGAVIRIGTMDADPSVHSPLKPRSQNEHARAAALVILLNHDHEVALAHGIPNVHRRGNESSA